jgi:hypothetical protein
MRPRALRKFAKGAGAVLVGIVALDLVLTAATLTFGWRILGG